ncbi:hypothetical protein AB0I00_31370 [Streptomyces sp. NPDC050803]|uniref:hypothetical protein n=1 Tax=unclassified Streptomyces TaxID=2593676 RepID=UPI003419689C
MSIIRRLMGWLTGSALVAGALLGTAAPAQAYSPNPSVGKYYYDTDNCPCSGGNLTDPFDGTYFSNDPGGLAVKMELSDDGWFVGKVEFHPYDEKLWVYDTRNDGDTFVVSVSYTYAGDYHYVGTYQPPGTTETVDLKVADLDIPEGAYVDISVYDDVERSDLITAARGTGAAVA